MKKLKLFLKIILLLVLALFVYSLMPVLGLYIQKSPGYYTNKQAVEKLRDKKGDYFEFIVVGDNHGGFIFTDSAALKLIRNMNREDRFKKVPIDFVANLGDVTFQKGTEWDYKTYNKLRSRIKWPVISAAGNHDDDERQYLTLFKKYVGEKEFSFVDRNSCFIVLNNRLGDFSDSQFVWLEEELKKASSYRHRFIFSHKSPLSLYQQSWFRPELSPWAYRFMKLCERYKVDIVFAGHEHMFREGRYGGVTYIMSGGGGMFTQIPESDGGFLHYVVVRVYGDYVDYEVRKITPPFWEVLTYYMWKELFYFLKFLTY